MTERPEADDAPLGDLEDVETEGSESPEEGHPAILGMYLKDISRIPRLTPKEERELALRAQAGDAQAGRRMVEASLRLVFKIAKRYVNRGLPLADLIEEGNLGLFQAVQKFRPDRGTRFSTYATWWIRHAISRALANQARMIRLPVHIEALLARYHREQATLTTKLGRPPTPEEIAEAVNITPAQIAELETVRRHPLSLDAPQRAEAQRALEHMVGDRSATSYTRLGSVLRERTDFVAFFDELTENERRVLRLRFGLNGEDPITLEAIGHRLGLTRERVRQIQASGLKKLRRLLTDHGIDVSDFFA